MQDEWEALRAQAREELEMEELRKQAREELELEQSVPRGTQQQPIVPRGTEEDDLAQLKAQAREELATEDPGFFSNLKKGSEHGQEDLVRQATIFNQLLSGEIPEPVPVPQSEELGLSRKAIGQFGGRMLTAGAPSMVGGLAGAKLGAATGALGGPLGATVGGITGGIAGSAPIATAQAYVDAYNEARLSGQEHEKALEHAASVAKISGGVNTIAGALGAVGLKDAFLKHALKQIPIQTAASNVENIARNLEAREAGVDPERDLLAGTKEATFGPGALHVAQAAGTKALIGTKNIIKGKAPVAENVPHRTITETETKNVPHGTKEQTWQRKSLANAEKEYLDAFNQRANLESIIAEGGLSADLIPQAKEKINALSIQERDAKETIKLFKPMVEALEKNVPRGTQSEKPRVQYDPETKKWVPAKKATGEKSTVVPVEETNLGRKKGATEEQKAAADVNLDEVHQKIFGNEPLEKPPSFLSKIIDKSKDIYKSNLSQQGLFDAHAPIKAAEAKNGVATPGEGIAYRGARFARNVSGTLKAAYEHGRPYWDTKQEIMRVNSNAPGFTTIIEAISKTPKMLKDFQTYAYARRVKSNNLIETGQEQNMKHHEVNAALEMGEKNPQFKQTFEEIQEYNNAVLDVMEDTGLINKDKRAEWEQMDYVPFYRELSDALGAGITTKGKGLTGQKAKIKPLKGEKKMWQVLDEKGKEINRLPSEKEATAFAEQHDLQVAEQNVGHKTSDIIENLYKNISSFLPAAMKNAAAVNTLHVAQDLGAAKRIPKKESVNALGNKHPDVVTVMEDGKPVHYKVTDEAMYKAVTESYGRKTERGTFGKAMQGVKSVFSGAIVSNPGVAVGIAAKDIIQSGLVGKYSMGNIKGLLVDLPKELVKSYAHEFGIKTDKRLVDISAMGAESRFSNVSPEMRARQMSRHMDKMNGKMLTWANKDALHSLIDKIITPAENANRLRKFEAARKAGKDIATSGYEALDYMDYGKKGSGSISQFLRDFVPFAGSHLSSSHTLGTELAHKKGLNPTTAKLLTLSAFSGLNASFNLDESNDPDPSNGYMAQPDYVRDNNWLIDTYKFSNGKERFKNGDTRWIVIPKPWEAGQLGGSVIENAMAYQKGEADGMDIINYMRKQFMDYLTINPIGHPIIKTGVEQFANKQFFLDMPIVPRQTEELAPSLQYGPKTSKLAKDIGETINFSPARIEHAAKGILGSYADYIFMASDILDKSQGEKPESGKVTDKYIFNKFVKGTVLERTSYENEMYELYRSTKEAAKTLKHLDKIAETDKDVEKAEKYAEKKEHLIDSAGYAESMRKMVKDYNDQIADIRKDKELNGREKKAAIDEVIKEKNEALYEFHQEMKEEKRANKKGK